MWRRRGKESDRVGVRWELGMGGRGKWFDMFFNPLLTILPQSTSWPVMYEPP